MAEARRGGRFWKQLSSAPNLLTLLRLGIIPFLLIALLRHRDGQALLLFMAAGASDGLDGLLARVLDQRTVLGQYLDPIADKLLLSTLFVVLAHVGSIPDYVTILVISRDLGILIIATLLFAAAGRRRFPPSVLGKANTVIQILALWVVMVEGWRIFPGIVPLKRILLDATVCFTVASAAHYAWRVSTSFGSSTSAAS